MSQHSKDHNLFETVLCGLNGEPLIDQNTPMTLRIVASNALLSQYQDENPTGMEKVRRWALALRIHNAKETIVLTADEITLLKELIGRAYAPLVVGQAWSILDPASVK